jgi:tRNA G18 (ribose-2'-O)-methylase SpoU
VVEVEDPEDVRLGDYRDLKYRAGRRHLADGAVFVVEGKLGVGQLLASSYRVKSLLVDDHQAVAAADLVDGVRSAGAPVFVGRREVVQQIVGFSFHRGVVAVASRGQAVGPGEVVAATAGAPGAGGGPPLLAVLEGLNDHENIGALFRNAAAFGVGGVLLDPTCADPLYRRSVRVSVGHVLHVPFARLGPWPGALERVRAAGFLIAALAPRREGARGGRATISLGELVELVCPSPPGAAPAGQGSRGVALVLGAEGPGLSAPALDAVDVTVSIPMAAGVDSLNVATAAAVAFHRLSTP